MAPLNAMIANGAKRAAYSAGQAARVLWYTGHYAYGRRLMAPPSAASMIEIAVASFEVTLPTG